MTHAVWSPQAVLDLEEVAAYVAFHEGRPTTADRIVREVHALAELIATQPEMGSEKAELGRNCRSCSYKKRWMILYRPVTDGIDVVRFVDGQRDFDSLFPSI